MATAVIPDESRIPTVVAAVLGMLPLGSGAGGQLASRLERKLGISAAEARKRVIAYKQFLALKAASLDIDATKLSPPPLIDRVWHEHVLDTEALRPGLPLGIRPPHPPRPERRRRRGVARPPPRGDARRAGEGLRGRLRRGDLGFSRGRAAQVQAPS